MAVDRRKRLNCSGHKGESDGTGRKSVSELWLSASLMPPAVTRSRTSFWEEKTKRGVGAKRSSWLPHLPRLGPAAVAHLCSRVKGHTHTHTGEEEGVLRGAG